LKKIRTLIGLGLIIMLLVTACEQLPFEIPWLEGDEPTETPMPGDPGDPTPTPETLETQTPTPEQVTQLTVWVPPEMNPDSESEAGRLLASRIQLFSDLNNGIEIIVRVKAASGAGGLLDALTATSAAAPSALPDVIALSRPDLETAALKSLIYPLDGLTEIPDDADWYSFTKEMALLQGSTFGLPFAADALVMIYRPLSVPSLPTSWSDLVNMEDTVFVFPAESEQALFLLSLYQAEGGSIQDNQRRPVLEVNPLTEVFRLLQNGVESGLYPTWLNQYQTTTQVWTAFLEGQTDLVVTWFSDYLREGPADAMVVPFYPMGDGAVSLGTGMSWAVATPEAHRQAIAVDLAEFLIQPDFLSEWTAAAGYFPPRPSALDAWRNQNLRTTVSQVALMTRLSPSNDIIASLGPVLREGFRQILQGLVDPAQAAQVAVESLED